MTTILEEMVVKYDNYENEIMTQVEKEVLPGRPSQINLVMNSSQEEEDTIDLGNVFRKMKQESRKYLWLMFLLGILGVSIGALVYQFGKKPEQVSSVVTLKYEVNGQLVTDMTAPDGSELDLSMFTSSYVLNNALNGIMLSHPVSLESLRNNLSIQKIITKETRRQQELVESMMESKDKDAYAQAGELKLVYQNNFLVNLENGFSTGLSGDSKKVYLTTEEMQVLMERVISSYNEYLYHTYADLKLPGDEISVIDYSNLDVLDSLDQLSMGMDNLYTYCDSRSGAMKSYRSGKTGHSLNDLMDSIRTLEDVDINYLRSYVYYNSITNDVDSILTKYRYQLRQKEIQIEELKEKIATTDAILSSYQNDSVFVSSLDNATNMTTETTTEYYNQLVMTQADYYETLSSLTASAENLAMRIARLEGNPTSGEVPAEVYAELDRVFRNARDLYAKINEQISELQNNPFYSNYLDHTAAQGKSESFLKAGAKNMMAGAGAGIVITFVLWFMAALLPEMFGGKEEAKETAR